ncbi:hypothetical protein EAO71_00890 [Streptomyces sp. ms191]|nr:hypothetical protein EAO71_00890 [Streptomyces sp. ms191]
MFVAKKQCRLSDPPCGPTPPALVTIFVMQCNDKHDMNAGPLGTDRGNAGRDAMPTASVRFTGTP